jgi:hypothetical protein
MKQKKQIIIISIVCGAIAAFLTLAVVFPLIKSVKKDIKAVVQTEQELAFYNSETRASERFKNKYREIELNLNKLNALFVDPQAPISLIEFWEKAAADCGLSIAISPASLKTGKGDLWPFIAFQMTLKGSFPDFSRFLRKIESSFYLVQPKSLVVSKLKAGQNKAGQNQKEDSEPYLNGVKADLLVQVFTK